MCEANCGRKNQNSSNKKNLFKVYLSYVNVKEKRKEVCKNWKCGIERGENSIRIITIKQIKVQSLWKYKYEVISNKSKYIQNVDTIYSEKVLRIGSEYFLIFNTNQTVIRFLLTFVK